MTSSPRSALKARSCPPTCCSASPTEAINHSWRRLLGAWTAFRSAAAKLPDGDAYTDFALLWLACHQSRVEGERPELCWLEKWSRAAQEQGTRALDQLRDGIEAASRALGSGCLTHPANRL